MRRIIAILIKNKTDDKRYLERIIGNTDLQSSIGTPWREYLHLKYDSTVLMNLHDKELLYHRQLLQLSHILLHPGYDCPKLIDKPSLKEKQFIPLFNFCIRIFF